jgi:hypothetical protein
VLIVKKPVPAAAAQLEEMANWLQQQGLQVSQGHTRRAGLSGGAAGSRCVVHGCSQGQWRASCTTEQAAAG